MASKLHSFQYILEEQGFKVVLFNVFTGQPLLMDVTLETVKQDSDAFTALATLQEYAQATADSYDYKAENADIQAEIDKKLEEVSVLQALIK